MMGNASQIAVIVPVYNDAGNLHHCLAALLLARGNRNIKITVVDDGSTDLTPEVIHEFDVEHVKSVQNRGRSWARNHGAKLSSSAYVLFVDSDVVVSERCFELVEEFVAEDKPVGLVGLQGVCSLDHPFNAWSSQIYNTIQHMHTRSKTYSTGVNTSLFLIQRAEFLRMEGFREDMSFMEDTEFGRRMGRAGRYILHGTIPFVHRKFVRWRSLIGVFLLGGKTLSAIAPTFAERRTTAPAPGVKPRIFVHWLAGGLALIATLLAAPAAYQADPPWPTVILVVAILVLGFLCASCSCLWRVRRNPIFFAAGAATFLLVPWLIAVGRVFAIFPRVRQRERGAWQGRKIEALP